MRQQEEEQERKKIIARDNFPFQEGRSSSSPGIVQSIVLMGTFLPIFTKALSILLLPFTTTFLGRWFHLFELHDLDLCPAWLRNFSTEALALIWL